MRTISVSRAIRRLDSGVSVDGTLRDQVRQKYADEHPGFDVLERRTRVENGRDLALDLQNRLCAPSLTCSPSAKDMFAADSNRNFYSPIVQRSVVHAHSMDQAALDYRGEKFRLLSAANISFADGLKIDELKLGAQKAILQIEGEITPILDARASLQHVEPGLIGVFLPDLVSQGTIDGNARIQGSLSALTGRVSVNAHDIRFASDQALDCRHSICPRTPILRAIRHRSTFA